MPSPKRRAKAILTPGDWPTIDEELAEGIDPSRYHLATLHIYVGDAIEAQQRGNLRTAREHLAAARHMERRYRTPVADDGHVTRERMRRAVLTGSPIWGSGA